MKIAVLYSTGKDSAYALYLAVKAGHEVKALVSMKARRSDSYMYHVPNIELTELCAQAMDLPLVIGETEGVKEEELKELKEILEDLKEREGIEGVVSGALASQYQFERVQKICQELNLESINPLWQREQEEYMRELIASKFEVLVVGVYAQGLDEKWLGREIDDKALSELVKLKERYGLSVAGEGGEFETFVLGCPLYKKKIKIVEAEKAWDGVRGEFKIKKAVLLGSE